MKQESAAVSIVQYSTKMVHPRVVRSTIRCNLAGKHIIPRKEVCSSFEFWDREFELKMVYVYGEVGIVNIKPPLQEFTTVYAGKKTDYSRKVSKEFCLNYTFQRQDFEFVKSKNSWTLEVVIDVNMSDIMSKSRSSVQKFPEVTRNLGFPYLKTDGRPCPNCDLGVSDVRPRIYWENSPRTTLPKKDLLTDNRLSLVLYPLVGILAVYFFIVMCFSNACFDTNEA